MVKNINFSDEIKDDIQVFADQYMNGNFTMAVVFLCRSALDTFDLEAFRKKETES